MAFPLPLPMRRALELDGAGGFGVAGDLCAQRIDPVEALGVTLAIHEVHIQDFAVEISRYVEQMDFQEPLALFERGA